MVKVSVIINTVDRPTDLRRCLEAVLNQTYRDFEIVVVNNGTGDETQKLLKEFKVKCQMLNVKCKVIEDKTKKLSYLFNLGWKKADSRSDYFAYCADDTEVDENWLKEAVGYLESHPGSGGISGPTLATTDPPGEMFYLRDLAKKNVFTRIFLRLYEYFVMEDKMMEPGFWSQSGAFTMGAGIPLPHIKEPIEIDLLTSGNMVVTRQAMETVGGFDENFYFNHADGDLFIRLKRAGYRLIFHPKVKVLHHMRFGPTRYPWFLGRDTAFYYLKDVRPESLRGWIGAFFNLSVFNAYFVFKALQLKRLDYLKGLAGFLRGIFDFFVRSTPERNELLSKLSVGLGFIALFSYVYKDLWGYGMLAYGDTVPFPQTISAAWEQLVRGWDPRSPGTLIVPQIHVLYSLLPVEMLLMFFSGGNSIVAQRIFHYLPLPLSFLTMYFLLSKFVAVRRLARFFGSFIYSLNLFMIGEFLGGFEGNIYVQALLPVLLFFLWGVYQGSAVSAVSYTLLLSLAYVFSDHVFLFLLPFLLLIAGAAFLRSFRTKMWGSFINVFLLILVSHLSIFLITAYHSYPYFKVTLPYLSGQKIPGAVQEFLKGNVDDTYRFYTLGNALRTGGSYFMKLFGEGEFWARTGFILPLLSFSWFLFPSNRQGRRAKLGFFLTLLSVFDLIFLNFTRGERLSWLFRDLPFLFRFRNPSRPSLFLLFIYAVLSAFTVEGAVSLIYRYWRRRSVVSFSVAGLLFLAFSASVYYLNPALSGDLTMEKNRGIGAQISQAYLDLGSYLSLKRGSEGIFRTLFVPWNQEEAATKLYWLDPYVYAVPINYGAYLPASDYLKTMKVIYSDLINPEKLPVADRLARVGVKYVVVNEASTEKGKAFYTFDYQTPWLLGSAQSYEDLFDANVDFEFVTRISNFRIFRNKLFSPQHVSPEDSGLFPPTRGSNPKIVQSGLLLVSFVSFVSTVSLLFYLRGRSL